MPPPRTPPGLSQTRSSKHALDPYDTVVALRSWYHRSAEAATATESNRNVVHEGAADSPPHQPTTSEPTPPQPYHEPLLRYFLQMRGLNMSLLRSVHEALEDDPFADLCPVHAMYAMHREEIGSQPIPASQMEDVSISTTPSGSPTRHHAAQYSSSPGSLPTEYAGLSRNSTRAFGHPAAHPAARRPVGMNSSILRSNRNQGSSSTRSNKRTKVVNETSSPHSGPVFVTPDETRGETPSPLAEVRVRQGLAPSPSSALRGMYSHGSSSPAGQSMSPNATRSPLYTSTDGNYDGLSLSPPVVQPERSSRSASSCVQGRATRSNTDLGAFNLDLMPSWPRTPGTSSVHGTDDEEGEPA